MDSNRLTGFNSEEHFFEWLSQTMGETFDCSPTAMELIPYQLPPPPNLNLEFQDFDDSGWFDLDNCVPLNFDSSCMINVPPPQLQQLISDCNGKKPINGGGLISVGSYSSSRPINIGDGLISVCSSISSRPTNGDGLISVGSSSSSRPINIGDGLISVGSSSSSRPINIGDGLISVGSSSSSRPINGDGLISLGSSISSIPINIGDGLISVGSSISSRPINIGDGLISVGSSSSSTADHQEGTRSCSRRSKSIEIELEEIKRHFNVPITEAAREMKIGLTALKKRCRELHIKRWPHRKIKSLSSLIENLKELGLTSEVEMLEEHRRLMEKLPEIELTENTKKLRQAYFKAKYKKRRSFSAATPDSTNTNHNFF